ncbi:tetratricopeptide repeat protein [Streptomyces sp. A2-16]|uniref:tetratricopeptide repeat protein n=1 Tax=Streptomyces sp. A2-16 TaxID=2781734 RepID=UPI0020122E89|nr:tetratricopeptide repeat protein [Streptomyces sp. A2-16]
MKGARGGSAFGEVPESEGSFGPLVVAGPRMYLRAAHVDLPAENPDPTVLPTITLLGRGWGPGSDPGELPLPPGQLLAGQYRLIRPLGYGGMGEVHLALDTKVDNREVAIKMLHPEQAAAAAAALARERRALVDLGHDDIIRVFNYGHHPGVGDFLVLQYVDGLTLEEVRARAKLNPGEFGDHRFHEFVLAYGVRILSALAYLHAYRPGKVYGDLKPDNVMHDGTTTKIIDVGSVRPAGAPGMTTPGFSAPTVGPHGESGHQDDLFSLGETLRRLSGLGTSPEDLRLLGDLGTLGRVAGEVAEGLEAEGPEGAAAGRGAVEGRAGGGPGAGAGRASGGGVVARGARNGPQAVAARAAGGGAAAAAAGDARVVAEAPTERGAAGVAGEEPVAEGDLGAVEEPAGPKSPTGEGASGAEEVPGLAQGSGAEKTPSVDPERGVAQTRGDEEASGAEGLPDAARGPGAGGAMDREEAPGAAPATVTEGAPNVGAAPGDGGESAGAVPAPDAAQAPAEPLPPAVPPPAPRRAVRESGAAVKEVWEPGDATAPVPRGLGLLSLARVLHRATLDDPAGRFADAREMEQQLRGVFRELRSLRTGAETFEPSPLFLQSAYALDGALGSAPPLAHWAEPDAPSPFAPPSPAEVAQRLPVPRPDPRDAHHAELSRLADAAPEALLQHIGDWRDSTEVHLLRCRLRLRNPADGPDAAERELRAAEARIGPRHAPYDWRLDWHHGLLALARGQVAAAWRHFDRVYAAIPGEYAPKLALGHCAERLGRPHEALTLYEAVRLRNPSLGSAAFGAARARLALDGERAREEAVHELDAVPQHSRHRTAARTAAVRIGIEYVRRAGHDDEVPRRLGEVLGRLALLFHAHGLTDEEARVRMTVEVWEAVQGALARGALDAEGLAALAAGADPRLGLPPDEHGLREDLSRRCLTLAHQAARSAAPEDATVAEILLDRAYEVRPLAFRHHRDSPWLGKRVADWLRTVAYGPSHRTPSASRGVSPP